MILNYFKLSMKIYFYFVKYCCSFKKKIIAKTKKWDGEKIEMKRFQREVKLNSFIFCLKSQSCW